MDENRLKLIRDALRTIDRYSRDSSPNHQIFFDQLVRDGFYVSNLNSSEPTSIFDHLDVFGSDPKSPFSKRYQLIFRNPRAIRTNRRLWNNYLNEVRNYLDYLASPTLTTARNEFVDKAIESFAQNNNLTEEQKTDLQQEINPTRNNPPPKTDEKLLNTGMETFQASETPNKSSSGQEEPKFIRRIIHSSPEAQQAQKQALEEGKYQLEMGLIKGLPPVEDAAKDFGRAILNEFESVPILSGEPKENVVYNAPQEQTFTSTGGGRFSPGGRSIRIVTDIPKTIKRTRKGITGARLASTGAKQVATKNPWVWLIALVILFVLILLFLGSDTLHIVRNTALCGLPNTPCDKGTLATNPTVLPQEVIVVKTGPNPPSVDNPPAGIINYQITVSFQGVGTAKIDLTDKIPVKTRFASASDNPDRQNPDTPNETLVWHLDGITIGNPKTVTFAVIPTASDFWAVNNASATIPVGGITGGTGNGLLCIPDLAPELTVAFESAGVSANVSPSLLYAIAMAENGGSIHPYPPTGSGIHAISPCGAHGMMQIQHINDGRGINYGPSCAAIGGTSTPPEVWDGLASQFNTASGNNMNNADADSDSIFGAAFYVKSRVNLNGKGYLDMLTDAELRTVAQNYLGAANGPYADAYINNYRNAFGLQGTCGGQATNPQPIAP